MVMTDAQKSWVKKYRQNNREKVNEYERQRKINKRNTSDEYKLWEQELNRKCRRNWLERKQEIQSLMCIEIS